MRKQKIRRVLAGMMTVAMVGSLCGCSSTAKVSTDTAIDQVTTESPTTAVESTTVAETATTAEGDYPKDITLRVGTSCTVAQWNQYSDTEEPEGFDIDVIKYICDYYGWNIEWTIAEYASLWGMIDTDMIDTIANETTVNDERLEKYYFTNTYAWEGYSIVKMDDGDNPEKGDMDYWKGKTLCVAAGTNYQLLLDGINEEMGNEINVLYLDTPSLLLPAVHQGQADGAFCMTTNASVNINALGYQDEMYIQDAGYKNLPIVFGFAKTDENKEIIKAINDLLEQMHADGTLKELSEKWIGMDVSPVPEGEVNYVNVIE